MSRVLAKTQPTLPKNKGGRPRKVVSYVPDTSPQRREMRKKQILELLIRGHAQTLTEAAEKVDLSPLTAHKWQRGDPQWAAALDLAREVMADRLETELSRVKSVQESTAIMFRLKVLRPEYRDSYRAPKSESATTELLEDLKRLTNAQTPPTGSTGEKEGGVEPNLQGGNDS